MLYTYALTMIAALIVFFAALIAIALALTPTAITAITAIASLATGWVCACKIDRLEA